MLLSQNPNQEQEVQFHDSGDNGPVRDLSQLINIDRVCLTICTDPGFLHCEDKARTFPPGR